MQRRAAPPPRPQNSLQKQEQIKGPKNAPIARFDGLGCYQTHSEKSNGFQGGGPSRPEPVRGQPSRLFPKACPKRAPNPPAGAATASQARPVVCRISLLFQEQIKGPENAPIARFDGLGCYRTHSENQWHARRGAMTARQILAAQGVRSLFANDFQT